MSLMLDRSTVVLVPDTALHVDTDWRRGRLHKDPGAQARLVWFGVAAVGNVLIAGLAAAFGDVVDQAVAASLLVFCISIAARHDGIVRGPSPSDAGSGRTGSIS